MRCTRTARTSPKLVKPAATVTRTSTPSAGEPVRRFAHDFGQVRVHDRRALSELVGTDLEPPEGADLERFLYLRKSGETTCSFPAGIPSSSVPGTECYRPCTVRHEGVHAKDIKPCCSAAGKAHRAAATKAEKNDVEEKFFRWMRSNTAWFECRAYTESVRCADGMLKEKCSIPTPSAQTCCSSLDSYRASTEASRSSQCAKAAKDLTDCPFA